MSPCLQCFIATKHYYFYFMVRDEEIILPLSECYNYSIKDLMSTYYVQTTAFNADDTMTTIIQLCAYYV